MVDSGWWKKAKSIYDFKAIDIDGKEVSLEQYRNHVCIIVNVASNCTTTDLQYKELQALCDELGNTKGLRILAFPCNQFRNQEPGTEAEIKAFAKSKYNVTFDMFSKIDVNGNAAHPLWKYLKYEKGGWFTSAIKWNFTKFTIDKNGKPVKRYSPAVEPHTMKFDLEALLW